MTTCTRALTLICLLLTACGPTWVNANLSGEEAKAVLKQDTEYCQARVDAIYPLPEGVDTYGPPPSQSELQYNQQIAQPGYLSGYREDYDLRDEREKFFDKCMAKRGWQKK